MDNKNSNGEKTALIITVIVIIFAVLYLLYIIFLSNKNVTNNIRNTTNEIKNGIENTTNDIRNGTDELKNDVKNGVNDITNGIDNMTNNVDNTVDNTVRNNVGNESAKKETIKEEVQISAYTTNIYDKDEGRVFNISLANTKLNDTIIKQGEEFSFINTVGTMGESEGYKKTLGFDSNGKTIQIAGGGLCQLSSTLYNAVLDAGLEVTERHAHSRRVHYVPKDRDATVCYPSLDFKFKNTSDGDIKIKVTNDSNYVTVNLYKIVEH